MNTTTRHLSWCLPVLLLASCSSDNQPAHAPSTGGAPQSSNAALFDPTTSTVPLPNILATASAADPLASRAANAPMTPPEALAYINRYEMGGTHAVAGLNAPIYLRFTSPVDPATVTAANIKVFQLTPDTAGTENNPLGFMDVSGLFSYQYSAGGTDLFLFPNFPLLPGTRYLYVVSNRVKDADSQGAIIPSIYFNALKSTAPLTGSLAPLEAVRANVLVEGTSIIKLSGYAKVMDDLIASSATTTIASRGEIALMGRFITTGAGFLSLSIQDAATAAATRIPFETALRRFAVGALNKTWTNTVGVDAMFDKAGTHPTPDAYWTAVMGAATAAPASVEAVILGKFQSAQLSIDPVVAQAHAADIDLSAVNGAYNPAAGVVQPVYTDAALAGFRHSTLDGRSGLVPFVYIAPAGEAPTGGWPLVIFQHGITSQKETVIALAETLTSHGFALIAIDLPMHNALAAPDHTTGEQWGNDFMALGAPLATRSNIQQAAFNLNRLESTVANGGLSSLGTLAPSVSRIQFVGHSLGSMVGAYYLAGNTMLSAQDSVSNNMRGFLSVPGSRTAYLIGASPTFGPGVITGLEAAGIVQGTPTFHQFFQVTQSVIDTVDPATMTTPLAAGLPSRLSGRLAIQEAMGDQVISNPYTRYFGNALGGREVLGPLGAAVAPGFRQLGYVGGASPRIPAAFMYTLDGATPAPKVAFAAALPVTTATTPSEGYFQFDQAGIGHTFLLRPEAGHPGNIVLGQTQLLYFLGVTGNSVIVDPSAALDAKVVTPTMDLVKAPARFTILGH
jgi:hypothetical protein